MYVMVNIMIIRALIVAQFFELKYLLFFIKVIVLHSIFVFDKK